ncbi:outer membrane protein assembly factor [Flavobacteriaceae bacterium M23B6Z8]
MKKQLSGIFFLLSLCNLIAQSQKIKIFDIEGVKKNDPKFLKNIVKGAGGVPLDSAILINDIRKLKRLPGIANAQFEVTDREDGGVNVTYHIEESFTVIPEVNIWSRNDIFSFRAGVYDFNFLGKGMTVGGFYQYNGFSAYGVNFRAPYLLGRNWGIAVNHQNWTSEEPVFFSEGTANYKYSNTSFEILALLEIDENNRLEFGFNVFEEEYDFLSGLEASEIPQSLDLNKLLFKSVYTFDRLRYNYQYIEGIKTNLYTQYVVTKNNFQDDFFIFWNDFFYFKRIGERGNWANRLRFGISSNEETPFAPFSVDNNVNIRGVGFIIDRGTASLVLNTEYRYTLIDKSWFVLQGNVFTDIGTWRNPGGDFSDFTDPDNYRIYPGVGLRFMHKGIYNAVFRIDYGYGISKNANQGIVFGIGQYF